MIIKQRRLLALAGLLSVAFGTPALANDWVACDGYGAAARSGDGMSEYATVLLIFSPPSYGNTARAGTAQGASAISGCDAALSQLPAAHWRRKVNLLQARALHRVMAGQFEEALQDLDLAETAGAQGDALFDRSQRVGLALSRALALHRLDRKEEAESLLGAAAQTRPYERGVASVATSLSGLSGETPAFIQAQEHQARLEPRYRMPVALRLFDEGRYEDFLALRPYVIAPQEFPQLGELPVSVALREIHNREAAIQFDVALDVMRAYALTALGRHAEAEQALTTARDRLHAGVGTPPAPRLSGPALEQYTQRLSTSPRRLNRYKDGLEAMALAVARRRLIAEGRSQEVIEALERNRLPMDGSSLDILLAIAETLPPDQAAQARSAAEQLRTRLADARKPDAALDLTQLFDALPAAETPGRLAPWREAKRPWLVMEGSQSDTTAVGYRDRVGQDGLVTVRFRGAATPQAQVEEMALLRAAELAQQGGHKGFVIIDRRDTSWSISTTHFGVPLRSDPAGFESELDIRFVDPAGLTAPSSLLFDTDQVYAALAPVYMTAPPARR